MIERPQRRLTALDLEVLNTVNSMSHMGGSVCLSYEEYRKREELRKRGLLKFWNKRAKRWRNCCYDITDKGRKNIA